MEKGWDPETDGDEYIPISNQENTEVNEGRWRYNHVRPDAYVQNGVIRTPQGKIEGYVSSEGRVTRGYFETFQEIIKNGRVSSNNAFFPFDQDWGYVDDEGNVRQSNNGILVDKIIGVVRGKNVNGALAHFVLIFRNFEDKIKELEDDFAHSSDSASFYGRACNLLRNLENLNGLGDFQEARSRLNHIKHEAEKDQDRNRIEKKVRVEEVQRLCFPDNWRDAADRVKELQAEWREIGNAGEHDNGLWTNFRAACDDFFRRRKEFNEQRERNFNENARRKASLCDEADRLRYCEDWRDTSARLKEMTEDWKEIGFAGREKDNELWQRFNTAKTVFFDRQNQHFNQLERERQENAQTKAELCTEAENLRYSTDWKETSSRMKEMFDEWKDIGKAGRDKDDELWRRFNGARQTYYDRQSAHYAELDNERNENYEAKLDLCRQAENLQYSTDWKDTTSEMKDLMDEWKDIGKAGRDKDDELWQRFSQARQRFFDQKEDHFDEQNREFERRASQKEDLIRELEYYDCGNDWSAGNARMKDAMDEWKNIGFSGRDNEDDLWQRFNDARQSYFDARQDFFDNRPSR